MRKREEIKAILQAALRKEFPHDTIDVSDGYQQNIHVVVVSRRFDEMKERDKQDLLWSLIDATDLDSDEKNLISLLVPASPEMLK
jgi:acid stress-induced BolA-like protein IbaG/YrbA